MTEGDRNPAERSLIRVHAWIIVLVTMITMGVAAAVVLSQPSEYEAEAEVELSATRTRGAPIPPNMATERRVALSGSVARDAAMRMGVGVDAAREGLAVSAVADAEVLVISYAAGSPRRAVRGAEAFTQSYVAARNARSRERTVEVITQPNLLPTPTPVASPLILVVGLLGGLVVGTAGAFLWDRVSGRVRTPGELQRTGAPLLATGLTPPRGRRLGVAAARRGQTGYFIARLTALTGHKRDGVRILVTSAGAEEERAGTAVLIATGLASAGRQVVLVDADGSHKDIAALAEGSAAHGFGDVVAGRCNPEAAMRPTALEGLRIIGADSSPVQDVDGLTMVLGQLATRNIVVIAGPPLLSSAQGWQLAGQADVVLLVAELPRLRRRDAARAVEMLGSVVDAAVGWVLVSHRPSRRLGVLRGRRDAPGSRPRRRSVPRPKVGGRTGS